MAGINEGVQYLKSVPSVLKIMEIILLIVCIGPVGYFLDKMSSISDLEDDYDKKDNIKFFVGATTAAAIIALLFFLIFLSGLHKKIDAFNWAKTAAGIFLVLAILLLVASSLLADTVRYYENDYLIIWSIHLCKILDKTGQDARCGQLTAGAVFGFVSLTVFVVDAIIHFRL